MGSFSLVVATFAASLSPSAAGYAVGAAKRRAREHPTLTLSPFLVWIAIGGAWMMYGYLAVSSIFMEVSQSWIGTAFGISGIVLFAGGVFTEFTYRNRKLKHLSSASKN